MSKHSPGPWHYIGDEVVGVSANCNCPAEKPDPNGGFQMIADHPHEAHDIVPAIFEDDLPEGVTMDEHRANCKLIAAAPEMLSGLKDCIDYIRTYCGKAHGIDLKKWNAVVNKAEGVTS